MRILSLALLAAVLQPMILPARAPRIVAARPTEIAQKVVGRRVTLRLAAGEPVKGKVLSAHEAGLTIQARRRPARTIAWADVQGVRAGFSRSTYWLGGGLTAGSLGTISLVASGAPTRHHPLETVSVAMLGAGIATVLLARPLEYQPSR